MRQSNTPGPGRAKFLGQVLAAGVVGALVVTGITEVLPRTYTSSAVILFPAAKPGSAGGGDQPSAGPGTGGGSADQPSLPLMQGVLSVPQPGTSPASAALILRSRITTVDLVQRFGLFKEWRLPMERAIERFHERFVCHEGSSGDLRIAYTDRTPQRAQETIATAIGLLTRSVEELSVRPAAKNVAFVQDNLRKAETKCARIQDEIIRLQRKVGGTPPDAQIQAQGQMLADIQKELSAAEVQAAVADSTMKATSDVSRKILATAQDPANSGSALISTLYRNVADGETELAVLRQKFTDRRPEVVQARQVLAAARRSLEAETARQLRGVESGASPLVRDALVSVITARARVEGLRRSAGAVRRRLEELPAAQVRFGQLTADLRDERTRMSLLRSEYLRAQLIVQTRGPQFVMLDPPTLPKRPNGYDLIYFTVGGLLAGMLCACLWAAGRRLRRSMRDMKM